MNLAVTFDDVHGYAVIRSSYALVLAAPPAQGPGPPVMSTIVINASLGANLVSWQRYSSAYNELLFH